MHFSLLPRPRESTFRNFSVGCSHVSLLALSIVSRCQRLTGVSPDAPGCQTARIYATQSGDNHPFAGAFVQGNLVVAIRYDIPYVAEVVDVVRSTIGTDSYLVRYLDELPFGTIREDWVRPDFLQPVPWVATNDQVLEQLGEVIRQSGGNPDEVLKDMSQDVLNASMRESVVHMWREGLREFYKKNIKKT